MEATTTATINAMRGQVLTLTERLGQALAENFNSETNGAGDALDMLVGDLSMVALLLTNVDMQVSQGELDLLNGLRQQVYGADVLLLQSENYEELCAEVLRVYHLNRLTLDFLPRSIASLDTFDAAHGTAYGSSARQLFVQFAEALLGADQNTDQVESIMLLNFKDVLYPSNTTA